MKSTRACLVAAIWASAAGLSSAQPLPFPPPVPATPATPAPAAVATDPCPPDPCPAPCVPNCAPSSRVRVILSPPEVIFRQAPACKSAPCVFCRTHKTPGCSSCSTAGAPQSTAGTPQSTAGTPQAATSHLMTVPVQSYQMVPVVSYQAVPYTTYQTVQVTGQAVGVTGSAAATGFVQQGVAGFAANGFAHPGFSGFSAGGFGFGAPMGYGAPMGFGAPMGYGAPANFGAGAQAAGGSGDAELRALRSLLQLASQGTVGTGAGAQAARTGAAGQAATADDAMAKFVALEARLDELYRIQRNIATDHSQRIKALEDWKNTLPPPVRQAVP